MGARRLIAGQDATYERATCGVQSATYKIRGKLTLCHTADAPKLRMPPHSNTKVNLSTAEKLDCYMVTRFEAIDVHPSDPETC